MKADIYIITHNRPYYLFMTLDALTKNTDFDCRIFVGDNNSDTDENENILKTFKYCRQSINDFILFNKNSILNRNELIKKFKPKNEFIVIIDDDILVPKRWLTQLVDVLKHEKEYGALSLNISEDDRPDPNNKLTPDYWNANKDLIWTKKYNDDYLIRTDTVAGLVITKTSLFFDIGKFHRDCYYSTQVRKKGYKVGYLKNIYMRHLGYNMFYDYPDYRGKRDEFFEQFKK